MHVAEERNQAIATDYDEEDRYSGVLTKDLKARAAAAVPSAAAAAAIVKDDGETKKVAATATAPAPGRVMNYAAAAQAAAKKGSAELAAKAAATATAAPASVSVPKVPEDAERVAAALPAPAPPPVESPPAKAFPEEEKAEPKTADTTGGAEGDDKKHAPVDEGDAKKDGPEKDEKVTAAKPKLNPNAKSFTFNPTAKTFTPSFPAPSLPPTVTMMQQPLPMEAQMMPPHLPVDYSGGPHMMGNMGPVGPQFVPMHGEELLDYDTYFNIPYLFC
jgi:hypothetical protein